MTEREMLGYGLLAALIISIVVLIWKNQQRRRAEWIRNHGPRED